MTGSYDYWLVLLSVIVAIIASYVALDLASRVAASHRSRTGRCLWLAGGAWSMGTGIWSMHFIGMLALRLPVPASYDIPLTLLSGVPAVLASGFALFVVSRSTLGIARLLCAGLLMGIGIVSMQYMGMEAMRMEPPIRYVPSLAALSVVIAVAASVMALWSAFRLRMETIWTAFWKKAGSAVVMGSGICGMHYTAMAAARFAPDSVCTVSAQNIDPVGLAGGARGVLPLFLMATLLISAYDAYRAAAASAQVGDLSQRLVRIQDDERRSLAAELHDIVGQNLSAVNAELALLKRQVPPSLSRKLDAASALVRQSVDAVRNVMTHLRPPGLDELGLPAALRWHASRFESRSGIKVNVTADETVPRPSQKVEDALLRIYIEALSNIAKHAAAGKVEVNFEAAGEHIVMSIADNGRGFDTTQPLRRDENSGWGTVIMEERARGGGAELQVRSTPGGGTRVEFTLSRRKWS